MIKSRHSRRVGLSCQSPLFRAEIQIPVAHAKFRSTKDNEKSPLAQVKETYGSKEKLVDALVGLPEGVLDRSDDKDAWKQQLLTAANAKLLAAAHRRKPGCQALWQQGKTGRRAARSAKARQGPGLPQSSSRCRLASCTIVTFRSSAPRNAPRPARSSSVLLARVVLPLWGRAGRQLTGLKLLGSLKRREGSRLCTKMHSAPDRGEWVIVAHGSRVRDLTCGPDVADKDIIIAIVDGFEREDGQAEGLSP